jgi:integrase
VRGKLKSESLYPALATQYLEEAQKRGHINSVKTVRLYGLAYRQLQQFYPGEPAVEILTADRVAEWLRSGEWREKTVIVYRTAICSLVRFCAREGLLAHDFTERLKELVQRDARTHRVNNWLSADELGAIVRALPETPGGDRDRMVVRTAALTGLRAFELEALRWNHVGRDQILVPHGKGDKQRSVSISGDLRPHLIDWRARCAAALGAIPSTHPVLPVCDSRGAILWDKRKRPPLAWQVGAVPAPTGFAGLSVVSIQRIVKAAGLRIGVENLGPHDLRRSYAGMLDDAGVDLNTISTELGHANLNTTRVYLDANPDKRARKVGAVSFGL